MLQDVDLQHVAGRRAADVDRAGHEVRARALRHLLERREVARIDPGSILEELRLAARHPRGQGHAVAGVDLEDRGERGVEIAPDHVLGRGRDLVMAAHDGRLLSVLRAMGLRA